MSQLLGVRYVLEGSVRLASDRVRVTAQLVDGTTGHHKWADRYDARVVDIFDVQDEITKGVATELQVQLTSGEQARLWRRATTDVEAYDAFLRGREHLLSLRRDDNHLARALLQRAIARDERFGPAMVLLGFTHLADAWYGWSTAPQESLQRAAQLATLALTFDDTNADPYALLGLSAVFQGHYDEAISHARRAVLLSPNSADIAASHADVLNLSGRPEDGLAEIRRAMRLSPTHPPYYLSVFGHACWLTARYGDAIATYRRYAALEPENPRPRIALAALLALSGRESDAHTAAQEVLRLHPRFSVDRWARQTPNRNAADLARDVAALRKAGLT